MDQRCAHDRKRGKQKGGNSTDGKEKGESAMFVFLAPSGGGPIAGEVSENQVNVATRQVDLSDISGGG